MAFLDALMAPWSRGRRWKQHCSKSAARGRNKRKARNRRRNKIAAATRRSMRGKA